MMSVHLSPIRTSSSPHLPPHLRTSLPITSPPTPLIQPAQPHLRLPHQLLPPRSNPFISFRLHPIQLQNNLRQDPLTQFLIFEISGLRIRRRGSDEALALGFEGLVEGGGDLIEGGGGGGGFFILLGGGLLGWGWLGG